ncbi:uncharacterized protein LOC121384069 [Gigantopelta aegis]|uniref:uncharacterized protein LOC121384069 n=1 Tax=Gigantopelta aegis TaxID=1735272 RepID=UPI001B88AE70|nr:uncharacterized protein LOC121384069 [Gigantopelta aegis]
MKVLQILLFVIMIQDVCGLPTFHKRMVMFTDYMSWNAAHLICKVTGGALLTIKDETERLVVKDFFNQSLWRDEGSYISDFWIGLHVEIYSEPKVYYWSTCEGPFDLTQTGWLSGSSKDQCSDVSNSAYVRDAACSKDLKYICEYIGGECPFAVYNDTKGGDPSSYSVTANGTADCMDVCSSSLLDGLECWAATWHKPSRRCGLHFTENKTYYHDPANQNSAVEYTLYAKTCYSADVDSTRFSGYKVYSTYPFETCVNSHPLGQAKVYALFTIPKSWDEARSVCQQLGYELLIVDSSTDYANIEHIFGSTVLKYWIGLRGKNQNFLWTTGQPISSAAWAAMEPFNSPEETCVFSSSDKWFTANCSEQLPYICQTTNASCTYEMLKNTKGPTNNDQGSLDFEQCRAACESNADCRGFTHLNGVFVFMCYIHISQDPLYLYDSSILQSNLILALHRWTCAFGVTNDKEPFLYLPGPGVVGNNITEQFPLESSSSLVENVVTSSSLEVLTTAESISPSSITTFETTASLSSGFVSSTDVLDTMATASGSPQAIVETSVDETSLVLDVSTSMPLEQSSPGSIDPSSVSESVTFLQSSLADSPGYPTSLLSSYPTTGIAASISSMTQLWSTSLYIATEDFSVSLSSTTEIPSVSPSTSTESLSVSPSTSAESLSVSPSVSTEGQTASVSYTKEWTTAPPPVSCPCRCIKNLTTQETEKLVQEIQKALFVEPKSTSKAIMSKKSAEDPRPSAQTAGYAAIIFLTITFGVFFLLDLTTLVHHIKMAIQRLVHRKG